MDLNEQITPSNTFQKMDPEIKAEWIAALKSNKYKQGIGGLRNSNNEFCCLGVLCDIAAKKNIGSWENVDDDIDEQVGISFMSCTAFLPNKIMNWAKLNEMDGRAVSPKTITKYRHSGGSFQFVEGQVYSLSTFNDLGFSFDEIADIIDKNM